jgi:ribosome-binding protein aMBF1 (putative translation factor)
MKSLAEFIIESREKAGFSTYGLANKACIDLQTLEDIESGRELFLAVTTRQKLARALKCSPNEIKKYEREYEFEVVPFETIEEIKSKILRRETNLRCPLCGEPLVTRIAKMLDLEDNIIHQPKAHCVKCIFQIKE